MNDFKFKKEKKPLLNAEDLISFGWKREGVIGNNIGYSKDNFYLTFHSQPQPHIRIFFKDPSKEEWMYDPETFRVMLKLPTKDGFELLQSLL